MRAAGKPVVVSMGSVAASGGYWIATSSDEIWASPNTITGSIGIFGMFPTFQKPLAKHLGVRVDGVGTTWLSGALRPDRRDEARSSRRRSRRSSTAATRTSWSAWPRRARWTATRWTASRAAASGAARTPRDLGSSTSWASLDQAVAAAAKRAKLDGRLPRLVRREGARPSRSGSRPPCSPRWRPGWRPEPTTRSPGLVASWMRELHARAGELALFNDPRGDLRGLPVRGRIAAWLRAEWQSVHGRPPAAFSFEPFVVLASAAVLLTLLEFLGTAAERAAPSSPGWRADPERSARPRGVAPVAAPGTSSRATRSGRSPASSATCWLPLLAPAPAAARVSRSRPSGCSWTGLRGHGRTYLLLFLAMLPLVCWPPRCARPSWRRTRSTARRAQRASTSWPGRRSTRCSSCRSSSSSAGSCCTRSSATWARTPSSWRSCRTA